MLLNMRFICRFFSALVAVGFAGTAGASVTNITVASAVCANSSGLSASVSNAPGYTFGWDISGGTITAGANSNAVTFNVGSGASATLTVYATNQSGSLYSEPFNSLSGWTADYDGAVSHVASAGNPGGHLRLTFNAPSDPPFDEVPRYATIVAGSGASGNNFRGDLAERSSHLVVRFDLRIMDTVPSLMNFSFSDGTDSWTYVIDVSELPIGVWSAVEVPLVYSGDWGSSGLGGQSEFISVLSNVDNFVLLVDQFPQAADRIDIDNFELLDRAPVVGTRAITIDPATSGGTATAGSSSLCANESTTISLAGHAGSIQWQISNDGTSFSNVTGQTNTSLFTGNLTATRYYRAVMTSGVCAPATSTVALVSLELPPAPALAAASGLATSQFIINWGIIAASNYLVDVSTVSNFASFVSGYEASATTNNQLLVTGLSAGTRYFYRVRAQSCPGTSTNSAVGALTIPSTLYVQPGSNAPVVGLNQATLSWTATPNAEYAVYRTVSGPDDGSGWALSQTVTPETSGASATVSENEYRTYFRVVLQGSGQNGATSTNPVFGIIKPLVPSGYSLMSPPLTGNRAFNGSFGEDLATGLTGGTLASPNDRVLIREGAGWRTIYLHTSGQWREDANNPSTYVLAEGQGFYIYRSGGSVRPRFTGLVGNTGTATVSVAGSSWSIVGPSQGQDVAISGLTFSGGTPTVGTRPSLGDYDRMVILVNGNWRAFSRLNHEGNPVWIDSATGAPTTYELLPGTAAFYYRHGAGSLNINF